MADKGFWQNQMSKVKAGESPALTIEQQQEREKPELEMQQAQAPTTEGDGLGVSDVAKAAASGVVGWAESTSEIIQTPEMRQAASATLPGMLLSLADYVPVIRDTLVDAKRQTQEQFAETKEGLKASMSADARKALEAEIINDNLEFTDDATKLSTWIMKGTETIARMVPDLVAGGVVGKGLYKETYELALSNGIAKGLTPEGAKIAANKIANAAMMAPTAIASTTSAQGGAGVQVRQTIENLPWKELSQSDTFKESFAKVNADPVNAEMSNKEKLNLARTLTAEEASKSIMQDPALLTVNALASFIGDATLGRIVAGKLSGGIASKALTGVAAEAPTEAAQGAMEQYAQNLTLIDVAGQEIDASKGVAKASLESAVMGGVIGGGIGAGGGVVDKVTGRQEEPAQLEPEVEAPEVVPEEPAAVDRSQMTVPERRAALEASLEAQREEMSKQRVEAGTGEIQERLSRPPEPTPEELILRAPETTGPTPGELEFRRQSERNYIEQIKDAKIPKGLKGKPNAVKMMNKGYRNALSDFGGLSERMAKTTEPSAQTDTMSDALAKMGGISRKAAESEGFDPAMFKGDKTFSAKGTMSFDDAAESLNELGYTNREGGQLGSNDVVEMLYGEANNAEVHYSNQVEPEMMTGDAQLVRSWAKQIGGTDKLNTAVKKALNNEPLGKRQAEVVEDMLDTINIMRTEGAEQAKERLQQNRIERSEKRVSDFNAKMKEATGNEAHFGDIDSYNDMLNEMPDTYTEEQVILDELVATAGDVDFTETSGAIDQYEAGEMSLPNLLTKLSDIAEQRVRTYAEAKPATQKPSEPTAQPVERVVTERVEPVEAAPAAEPIEERAEPVAEEVPAPEPEQEAPTPEVEAEAPAVADQDTISQIEQIIKDRLQTNKDAGMKKPSLKGVRGDYIKAGLTNKQISEALERTEGYTDISALESEVKKSAAKPKAEEKQEVKPSKEEAKQETAKPEPTEEAPAPKVVNASSAKTVRGKVTAWSGIKFGDTIIDSRGARIGIAQADFNPKKPRAISILKGDGTRESFSFKTILGSDVETEFIDAAARGEEVKPIPAKKPSGLNIDLDTVSTNERSWGDFTQDEKDLRRVSYSMMITPPRNQYQNIDDYLKDLAASTYHGFDGRKYGTGRDSVTDRELKIARLAFERSDRTADEVLVKKGEKPKEDVTDKPTPMPEVSDTLNETANSENDRILNTVNQEVAKGFTPKNNNDLKVIGVKVFGASKPSDITANQLKVIQEAYETVSVVSRRKEINTILAGGKAGSIKLAYMRAVKNYESQPNLDVRTAKSSDLQAYSTPTPMALLANLAAGIDSKASVYEPTAGNGLLLMTANPKLTIANELDPVRASSLAWTGFDVTVNDATANNIGTKVDAVVANPPFGPMPKNENGDRPVVTFEDYGGKLVNLKEIDHVIARNALEAMKDDGKATLIIGANMKEPGVFKGNQKAFLNWLYSNYNVKHHVEVDGSMYKGQGAGFPTQMIVIDGRVRSGTGKFAPVKGVVKRIKGWDELYGNFKEAGLLGTEGRQFVGQPKGDGAVSPNTGSEAELRDSLPKLGNEPRNADIATKRDRDSGLIATTELSGTRSKPIGKPTTGTVGSQPDISATGMVGSASVLSGKSITDQPVNQPKPTRLPVTASVEPKGVNNKVAPKVINTKVDKANNFQAHYKTASNGFNEGVLTPNNMASYTQSALADLQERHGSVDQYVIDKLGYDSPDDMHKAFMGLQADSIALAVDNIENGRAIIIGDQTGVGKGRQAAGIIRYAMQQGKTPIFISQKPNLFTDMYDDLGDIGASGFTPLIMNNKNGFVSKGGDKLFNHSDTKRKQLLSQITPDGLPEGYDGLFLTYSQISSDQKGLKSGMLDKLSENAIIVMDESHSAAGQSKTGDVFQNLVNKAFGVTYLSATYAKRPDNMMLYMRTDLGLATDNKEALLNSVTAGGLGMQNYIAGKLAEAGQMVRRERSFDGININSKIIEDKTGATAKSFDKATTVLRTIQDVSAMWSDYVDTYLAEYIQIKHGLDTSVGGNKADKDINVTSFSSVVHNNIAQLALGLKSREAGRMAVEAIKQGKRPIIALDNTLGSALQTYMSDNGISVGDNAEDLTYATVLRNALDGVLAYSVKEPGADKGQKFKMPISDITDPMIKTFYNRAVSEIEAMADENIPGSPIDAIRDEIQKAGHSVAEITGRNVMVDYANNNQVIARPSAEMDRRAVVDRFNDGSLDVLILNQAGSTGLSIHASEKFTNQNPRHMIVAQPSLDINTYMQMLGRVNRTGQIELPSYDNVWLDLPSEKRPAAVLSRKMSSLNANTSGNTESATSVESVDLLNPYGDQVVKAFVEANGDYLSQFSSKLTSIPDEDTAVYFLGKMAVLPVAVQEEVIGSIESEYRDLIKYLDSTGQNELNMTELDLDAKPLSQKRVAEGKKGAGVFSDPVYLTKVDAKAVGKSPTWDEVTEAQKDSSQDDFNKAIAQAAKDKEFRKRLETRLEELKVRLDDVISAGKDTVPYEKAVDDQQKRLYDFDSNVSEIENMFGNGGTYSYGSFLNVVLAENEPAIPAVVVGLDYKHEKGSPYAASKWKLKLMVADRIAKIDIPLSLARKGSIQGKRWDSDRTMESRFNLEAQKPARETRYVMTGNLVEAQSLAKVKGQIKPITLQDGRIVQAMVLPRSFDAADDVSQKLSATPKQISDWLTKTDRDNAMLGVSNFDDSVKVRRHWRNEDEYTVEMPKSVTKGKMYWGNPAVEAVIGKQAVKGGGTFMVNLTEAKMKKLLKVMDGITPLSIKNQSQISNFNQLAGKKEKDFVTKGIVFSKTTSTGTKPKGVKIAEGKLITSMFLKDYRGAADIKVSWFQTQEEAMNHFGIENDTDSVIPAAYDPRRNEVVMIAENMATIKDVKKNLRHEILTHHGLMKVVGQEEWQNVINLVQQSKDSKDLADVWSDINRDYDGYPDNTKAEEVIARVAEADPGMFGEWRDRIVAAIVRAMRRVGFIKGEISKAEIRDMIRVIGDRFKNVGRNGTRISDDISFNQTQRPDGFSLPDETKKDEFIKAVADKFQRLKVAQKTIKEQGGVIDESKDVYLAEELFHGKTGEDLRVMQNEYIDPLTKLMSDRNLSKEELDLYLIAKHAPERNAYIASINPEMPDGGSGMTDAESDAILGRFNAEGKTPVLREASAYVYGMLDNTRQRLADSGLETYEAIESWSDSYSNYVPLKGFAENEVDNDGNQVRATGKGFSITGKETMQALGRKTMAESPLANTIADAVGANIRARKNEVAQSMLEMVKANPDKNLWEVFTNDNPDMTRTRQKGGEVKVTPKPMAMMKDQYFGAKVGGEQYYIKIKDPALMDAMKNLGVDESGKMVRFMGRITRFLSAMITSFNPEFAISNFARDVQTAIYNVLAETEVKGGKALGTQDLAMKMVKDIPAAMKALKRGLRDDDFGGTFGQYFDEYLKAGAKTGWFVQKNVDEIKKDIQRAVTTTGPGALNSMSRAKDGLLKFVDDYNDVIENASRLSVYVNARRQGLSVKQSASLAKNLTVNFNRRGEMTNTINSVYMFFNASIQGTANLLRAIATPKDKAKSIYDPGFYNSAQKIAIALPFATMALAMLNREMGGDDDDGKAYYDKLEDYVKETNFVLMLPGTDGEYIKIPMPYGYNVFAASGVVMDSVINTEKSAAQGSMDMLSAVFGSFSPLGSVKSEDPMKQIVKMASPAVLKPFAEMATNENFFGAEIYARQNPFGAQRPESFSGKQRTWEWTKGVTEYINRLTGGDEFEKGGVDIAPETIQHLTKFIGGGLGALAGRTTDLFAKGANGDQVDVRDIPFLRKVLGEVSDYSGASDFYNRIDELKIVKKQATMLPPKERLKFIDENRPKLQMVRFATAIGTDIKRLNKFRNKIRESSLSDEVKDKKIKIIEEQKEKLITKFNKKYNELVLGM